jgi:hypothetical protein
MATTRISDVVVPEVYATYTAVNSPEKTAIYQSGIIERNAFLDQQASGGGNVVYIPFWNDLDGSDEANVSSDDPAQNATALKISAGKQQARIAYLNQVYSAADLAGEVAGSDPMQRIRNRFGSYWVKQWQRRMLSSAYGVLLDNQANDSGDMVNDIASESIAGQSASTRFSRAAFTTAAFTLGDSFENVGAIAVHSSIYKQMVDQDDIDYIRDSDGNLVIATYLGKQIIVDDGATTIAGSTDGVKYVSILFGNGAFGYGEGTASVPVEVEREALQGNGGGVEYLVERKNWLLHPFGYQFTGSPSGESATIAELANAGSWDRVVERKNVPMAFLVTN